MEKAVNTQNETMKNLNESIRVLNQTIINSACEERKKEKKTVKEETLVPARIYLILEDLKVLRRSPDLFDKVKIGPGQGRLKKTYFVLPYMGVAAILH